MTPPRIGTREEWLAARRELLAEEKALTRRSDALAQRRRELPWVPVGKTYVFDTAAGERTLEDLFAGRSQLLVYHFMFGPDWEAGCPGCSFWADNFDRGIVHLAQRDVTMLCASRAPLARLDAYKLRMGWQFDWVSSLGNDFNVDFGVSFPADRVTDAATYNFARRERDAEELPGLSAFALADGVVYHTYSCYARGLDAFNGIYQLLDRAPHGRNEDADRLAYGRANAWLRRRDEYGAPAPSRPA
jgi:predicted dithiol-disulfide oxidoreductase (DUF899 family)